MAMSNVTCSEIFSLTADTFGVTIDDMTRHWRGNLRARIVLPVLARGVATILCKRHTEACDNEVARTLGWHNKAAGRRFKELAEKAESMASADQALAEIIDRTEAKIDALHEQRADLIEAAQRKNLSGLVAAGVFGGAERKPKRRRRRPDPVVRKVRPVKVELPPTLRPEFCAPAGIAAAENLLRNDPSILRVRGWDKHLADKCCVQPHDINRLYRSLCKRGALEPYPAVWPPRPFKSGDEQRRARIVDAMLRAEPAIFCLTGWSTYLAEECGVRRQLVVQIARNLRDAGTLPKIDVKKVAAKTVRLRLKAVFRAPIVEAMLRADAKDLHSRDWQHKLAVKFQVSNRTVHSWLRRLVAAGVLLPKADLLGPLEAVLCSDPQITRKPRWQRDLAEQYGVDRKTVYSRRRRLLANGVLAPSPNPFEQLDAILGADPTITSKPRWQRDVAEQFGVDRSTVRRHYRKLCAEGLITPSQAGTPPRSAALDRLVHEQPAPIQQSATDDTSALAA